MSVRPIAFNADGSLDVVYDERGHSGTLPVAEVVWLTSTDGSESHNFLVLNCPDGCGGSSTHPVAGGAAPVEVQQLFVHKTEREGCACGTVAASTTAAPEAHVRLNCNRMDGPGRWQLDTPVQRQTRESAPNMFQVVYRDADRLIVGLEPSGGVGSDNAVAVIHDMVEYDVLMRTEPAYLSNDGDHILSAPEAV